MSRIDSFECNFTAQQVQCEAAAVVRKRFLSTTNYALFPSMIDALKYTLYVLDWSVRQALKFQISSCYF